MINSLTAAAARTAALAVLADTVELLLAGVALNVSKRAFAVGAGHCILCLILG